MTKTIEPLTIIVDTNVFDEANYLFEGMDLGILKQYVSDGVIGELIISDIMVRECKRHLKEGAEELVEKFNDKIFANRLWTRVERIGKLGDMRQMLDKKAIAEELIKSFDKYLEDVHAKIIDSKGVELEDILADYFAAVPPFKVKKVKDKIDEHKKHEFPDAIAIAKLKQIINKYDEVSVVSSDDDWKDAFANYGNVKFYKSLKDLFATITAEHKVTTALGLKYFEENKAEFNNYIEDILMTKPVYVNGQTCDRHGVCEGYDYDDFDILNFVVCSKVSNVDYIGAEELIMTVNVRAEVEIECSYFDDENSVWDSEDKEYYYEARGLVKEIHKIEFPVEVVYKVENERVIKRIRTNPYPPRKLTLDEDTLVSRRPVDTHGLYSHKNQYKCDCGHRFIVDLMDYVDETTSTADRGMGAEFAHSILCEDECPHCGRKYKISGEIYEYPIGAFNADETKIEWEDKE